ncbi:hypothetical protein ACFV8T_00090 [Streptomyces sp. NPDC059832]|uniref:hypothetical protein n=1 Tax=unclassified Streptomyces TaxID=2593676 RepID=UPI0036569335
MHGGVLVAVLLTQGVVPELGDVTVIGCRDGLDRRLDIGEELRREDAALGVQGRLRELPIAESGCCRTSQQM